MIKFIRKMLMFKELKNAIKEFNRYIHDSRIEPCELVDGMTRVNSEINRLKLDLVGLGVAHEKIDNFIKGVK